MEDRIYKKIPRYLGEIIICESIGIALELLEYNVKVIEKNDELREYYEENQFEFYFFNFFNFFFNFIF